MKVAPRFYPGNAYGSSAAVPSQARRTAEQDTSAAVMQDSGPVILPGSLCRGRYILGGPVWHGEAAVIYRGVDQLTDRPVSIKMLRREQRASLEIRNRLEWEARFIPTINNPNVFRVTDAFREGDDLYLVGEPLAGMSLKKLLAREKRLTYDLGFLIFLQLCEAVAEIHAAGLVHAAINPENVFVTVSTSAEQLVKIVDLGLSKHLAQRRHLSFENAPTMDPSYLSPEQCRNMYIDKRSDIYSIGVVMYESLAGNLPFTGRDFDEIRRRHIFAPTPGLNKLHSEPDVPDFVENVVLKCLEKQPDNRYQSALELRSAIISWKYGNSSLIRCESYEPLPAVRQSRSPAVPQPVSLSAPQSRSLALLPSRSLAVPQSGSPAVPQSGPPIDNKLSRAYTGEEQQEPPSGFGRTIASVDEIATADTNRHTFLRPGLLMTIAIASTICIYASLSQYRTANENDPTSSTSPTNQTNQTNQTSPIRQANPTSLPEKPRQIQSLNSNARLPETDGKNSYLSSDAIANRQSLRAYRSGTSTHARGNPGASSKRLIAAATTRFKRKREDKKDTFYVLPGISARKFGRFVIFSIEVGGLFPLTRHAYQAALCGSPFQTLSKQTREIDRKE